MLAHIPDDGLHTQLGVLGDCTAKALDELYAMAGRLPDSKDRIALSCRLAAARMLWQTCSVLAGNFEQASGVAIATIARFEMSGAITKEAADELMACFYEWLGDMYVSAMAAQPA